MKADTNTKLHHSGSSKTVSRNQATPPKNPNKRPTTINMERSIGRMKAHDMDVIRQVK
ncbi:hypothetical protein PA598K_01277 [Paenibacillus sp. 598K]|nr:hypothetical protein PA598K_01277 [Paenibacillus sp. 598K]